MTDLNYFNYFTEIEEHFWKKRGAHLLVSPLDWAIVETWQKAGISLPAVLKGIDRAFESFARSRRAAGGRQLKSLAYCVDAVLDAAEEEKETGAGAGPATTKQDNSAASFQLPELRAFFSRNQRALTSAAGALTATQPELAARFTDAAARLERLLPAAEPAVEHSPPGPAVDLEDIERQLTVMEEKITSTLTTHAPEQLQLELRRDMDRQLAPYRRKMSAAQLAQLERQYVQKQLWARYNLPRLSLFYLT